MEIKMFQLEEGASKASGLVVVIDVFRAFSTACYIINNRAEKIIPVASVEEAYHWKEKLPQVILTGERNERKCEGFDFGNSPTHIQSIDFTGKTVVQTTSAGTKGLVLAKNAEMLVTGSFVNAGAVVKYINKRNPKVVSLVCMGYNAERECQEDTFCAQWMANALKGNPNDFDRMVRWLRTGDGARLLDPANHEYSPASDFDLCLSLNRFNFVLEATKHPEGWMELKRIDPH